MRHLPADPVFTRAEARSLGWTDSALTRAVRSGRLVRPAYGMFARPDEKDARAIAASQTVGGSVVSHRSALAVHGLPVVGAAPPAPELTVAPLHTAHAVAGHVYRATLLDQHVTVVDGVPVTSVARTLVDVGRHRSLAAGVSAIDAALRREDVLAGDIEDVLRFCWNWPRIRRAQRAYLLSDGRAESPLESISRLAIRGLRLPMPEPQKWIFDRFGRAVGRVDFYWDELGVAGEADGRLKYTDNAVLTAEKERQEQLEDLGLTVVRWGWDYATRRYALRAKLLAGFERAAARRHAGLPRLWTL